MPESFTAKDGNNTSHGTSDRGTSDSDNHGVEAKANAQDSAQSLNSAQAFDAQGSSEWKIFRIVVAAIGAALAALGVYGLMAGIMALPGVSQGDTTLERATLESGYRFLCALLIGVGAAFIAIAIKFEWSYALIFVCSTIFLGGLAQVLSWALSGMPHVLLIFTMIAELVVPPVIVVWYLWIKRTQQLRESYQGTGAQGVVADSGHLGA